MNQLPNLDFEAVRIFVSLLETLNLSKTADACGISVSSASRTLSKLREALDDELFHRYPHGMRPTARARELEFDMRFLLRSYEKMLRSTSNIFSPARESRMFRVGAVDQGVFCYLSYGLSRILQDAPNCGVNFLPLHPDFTDDLKSGALDLALFPYSRRLENFRTQVICRDTFVYAVLVDHPLARRRLEGKAALRLEEVNRYRKLGVSVAPANDIRLQPFSEMQSQIELRAAQTAVWTPYFLLLPMLLSRTDLIAVMPLQLANNFIRLGRKLVILGRSADAPIFEPVLVWHEKSEKEPALQWLRSHFLAAIPPLPGPEDVPMLL